MDERMTICNMSIEAGARAGMIAPDATTFEYLKHAPRAPKGADVGCGGGPLEQAAHRCRRHIRPLDRHRCRRRSCPWSLTARIPAWSRPITGSVPAQGDAVFEKALKYMGLKAGEPIANVPVNNVFVGSCTNGRLSDLRNAARVLRGHKLAQGVKMLVVPGSQSRQTRRRSRRSRPGVPRRRRRVARERLLDVSRHERRPRAGRPLFDQHQQPELRRPPGPGCAHPARQPRNRGRFGHPRPRHRSARIRELTNMPAVRLIRSRTVALPATNVDTDQIIPARFLTSTSKAGFGKHLFADWRYDADGNPKAGLRVESPRSERRRASSSPAATSAAARHANTRPGRCRISASRPSSAPSSRTSSAPTASRTACCRWSSTRNPCLAAGEPGRRNLDRRRNHHAHAARRHAGQISARRIRAFLPAEWRR